MSQLIYSYVISLETQMKSGNTPGGMIQDGVQYLDQDIANVLDYAKSTKLLTTLNPGAAGEKTYNLQDYGINYLRCVLVKVTDSALAGSSVNPPLRVKVDVVSPANSATQFKFGASAIGKSIFIDYDEPAAGTLPIADSSVPGPIQIKLNNPSTTPISVVMILVGH